MIRIVLVDAERKLHHGIHMRLDSEPDIRVVDNADNLTSAVEVVAVARPDIVLMDPVGLGSDLAVAVGDVLRAHPESKVVVLSLHDDPESRDRMLAAGASAFISKHDGHDPLPDVLRRVVKSGPS